MNFFNQVSKNYIDIVKWFLLIVSTILLVSFAVVFFKSITLPNHPVFNTAALSESYKPEKSSMSNEVGGEYIKKYCSQKDYKENELLPSFALIAKKFKKDGAKYAGCFQEIVKAASVPERLVPEWYSLYDSTMNKYPKGANPAAVAGNTANFFMIKYSENESEQRNFSFDLVKGAVSLSLFLMFVFSCMFLVLVRIENNTRK